MPLIKEIADDSTYLVYEYMSTKSLMNMGYKFNGNELSSLEAETMSYIHSQFQEQQSKLNVKDGR